MRRWLAWLPVLAISIAFWIAAAFADNDAQALFLLVIGASVPAFGIVVLTMMRMARWRSMATELGLVVSAGGAYPDLIGRYQGKRLSVTRRQNPYGNGPRVMTVVRLEGMPEIRMPGIITRASTVTGILAPLLESRGSRPRASPE